MILSTKLKKSLFIIIWFIINLLTLYNPLIQGYRGIFILYIIAGLIVTSSFFYFIPILERKVYETYNYVIQYVVDSSKIPEYREDTEKWIKIVFHRDYSFMKKAFIYSIAIGILVFFSGIILKVDIFLEFVPEFDYQTQKELILLLSTNGFGIVSILTLFYCFLRVIIVVLGTGNIIHHFTFWELGDDMDENKFLPFYEKPFSAIKRIGQQYFILPTKNIGKKINHNIKKYIKKQAPGSNSISTDEGPIIQNQNRINPLGELIILNISILILQTAFLMNFFLGYILPGMIFVISPINPTRDYSKYISKRYDVAFHYGIPIVLLISGIIRLITSGFIFEDFFFYIDPHFQGKMALVTLIVQYILIILFYRTWYRFIKGKAVKREEFTFDLDTPMQRFARYIKFGYKRLILTISIFPIIAYLFNIYSIISNGRIITFEHGYLLIYSIFFSIALIIVYLGIIRVKDQTKNIAQIYYPYTWKDKLVEMRFHFYETISSPQKLLFSAPFAFIFLIWAIDIIDNIILSKPELFISPLLKIPYVTIFFFLGLGFGEIIWCFYHAIHFSWHSMSLTTIKPEDLEKNQLILNSKPLDKQFILIVSSSLPAIILFGLGYYGWRNFPITMYLIVFPLVFGFFIFMTLGYRFAVKISLNKKRNFIINQKEQGN